jgi:hypothetical protein
VEKKKRPKREFAPKESMAFLLLTTPDRWENANKALINLDKVWINFYIDSLGVNVGHWLIGSGNYACAICEKDRTEVKLQKINHIGYICQECALKYQTRIKEIFKMASMKIR